MPAGFIRTIALAFPLAALALPLASAEAAPQADKTAQAGVKPAAAKHSQTGKSKTEAKAQAALQVSDAWARQMLPAAKLGAGYFEIKNNGDETVRLIAVRSAVARKVEIHSMTMAGNVMKMRHLKDGIDIPPHSGLSFKPGSYHLMFIAPKAPFKAGEKFKARFVFANGAEMDVPFAVRAASGMKPMRSSAAHTMPATPGAR